MYLCEKSTPIANKLVFNRKLIKLTNFYNAQATRSFIINSDWSKQRFLSKFDQTTALLESCRKLVTKTYF